ncbi:MAG: penicillin-binding protein, partial [Ignavibacteria bacterium]
MAKTRAKKKRKFLGWIILFLFIVGISVGSYILFNIVKNGLPSFEELENPKPQLASKVYSVDGELIGTFYRQNRIYTPIDSLPKALINALVATEDRNFYHHWGVDLQRFVKAMVKNIILFRREGASTITQQLAKNLFELKYKKETLFDTGVRKLREWVTAVELEKSYTKNEILEMYLNISYFGRGAHGVGVAAQTYFGKRVQDLSIPECAVLVALLKSPLRYDPYRNYNYSLQRRNLVMYNMCDVGMISREEYDKLKAEPIVVNQNDIDEGSQSEIAPHFVEYVRRQLGRMSKNYGFDIYEDGLTIKTTLDTRMQKIANKAVHEHLNEFQKTFDRNWDWKENAEILDDLITKAIKNRKEYRRAKSSEEKEKIFHQLKGDKSFVDSVKKDAQQIEVGFVVLDVKTGEIRAMVGGRNPEEKHGLNRTTQIKRQP